MRQRIECARNAEKSSAMPSRPDARSAIRPATCVARLRPSSFATTPPSPNQLRLASYCGPLMANKVSRLRNTR